jgi:hypothetical protein
MWLTGYFADEMFGVDYFSKVGLDPVPGTGSGNLLLMGVG